MLDFDEWTDLWAEDIEKEFEESGSIQHEFDSFIEAQYMNYIASNEDAIAFEDLSSIHQCMMPEV
jgi:hypothetical protein